MKKTVYVTSESGELLSTLYLTEDELKKYPHAIITPDEPPLPTVEARVYWTGAGWELRPRELLSEESGELEPLPGQYLSAVS